MFFDNEFGQSSNSLGLLKVHSPLAVEAFIDWMDPIYAKVDAATQMTTVSRPLREIMEALLPVVTPIPTRHVFVPLQNGWTMYLNNFRLGTDSAGAMQVLSKRLGLDSIRVVADEQLRDPATKRIQQYGATIFEYYRDGKNKRTVYSANDGGRWVFDAYGDPFEFEEISTYSNRLMCERFPKSLMLRYLRHLGIDFSQENTMKSAAEASFLVERVGKPLKNYRIWSLQGSEGT